MSSVGEALTEVRLRIDGAAREAKRDPDETTLIAVSKTFDAAAIKSVIAAGQRHFGENRVQEAHKKWPALKTECRNVTLHMIGPLQSNKTKDAVALFDAVHTVDRPKIAKAIAEEMARQERRLELFVEVNTGEEPQKAGIMPREVKEFVGYCRNDLHLAISGLMCIPPIEEEPGVHFAFLAKLAKDCRLPGLSMGMSEDFEKAVRFGATHVRVGSAIFGARAH